MRQSAEMETWMTSVGRILEYGQLESEEDESKEKIDVPDGWPEEGKIEFQNVSLQYNKEENLALSDISFRVKSGEKVQNVNYY